MAYVTPIYGGSAAQVDYRLGITQHGCDSDVQFRYHADGRERPLRWIGNGLPEFGLGELVAGAELTVEQHDLARALMTGKHPVTGEQLVAPKLAVPADAKVPLGPLVAAVQALAVERGLDPVDVFAKPKQRSAWNTAVRAVARRGDAALLRVDDALALAEAAGLEAEQVWPDVDLLATYGNLYEPQAVVDEDGASVLDGNGRPKMELAPRRVPVGIVGFDIGVTLPKSTSLLLAFLPDDLVDRVEAGYTAAIERTFGWVEGRTSYVRRGKHGDGHTAGHEATSGFSGWVMTHRAARPVGDAPVGDPHWHVHITVANLAKAADGTWLTVAAGGRDLMRHAPAIDKVTQAQVRAFLHGQLGITFSRSPRTGLWEVKQVPDEAIVYFSKRGQQVSAVLQQLGYSNADVSAAEARILTRESRSAKSETIAASDATLRGLWRADAVRGGLDPDALTDSVLAAYRSGKTAGPVEANTELAVRFGISLDDLVAKLTDPEHGLTAHARRFSHLDAIAAVADALPHGATIEDVERLTDLALAHPAFEALPAAGVEHALGGPGAHTQLAGAHRMTGGTLYTTTDVTAAERTILAAATAASDPTASGAQDRARVPAATVDLALGVVETAQGFPLSAEQRDVLHRVVTNGRAVEAVEGPPGTGKTTLMRAARVAWEAAGYKVAGAATAAVAAQNLAAESGIPSRTVAQWLRRIDHRDGLTGIDVLVLDEANLTSDRDRATLYTAAAQSGTKIVEVGDPQQLRGVGVGSMFGYLHQLLDGPRLTENRRQRQADERNALTAFRDGRHAEALHTWARLGEVVATETSDEAVAAMVSTWLRLRDGAPEPHTLTAGLLMLAATNDQVARINDATQAVRQARGELGDTATYRLPGGRETRFHVGDLVLIRRNDRHQQAVTGDTVLNGYRGVVTAVTAEGVEVAWRDPTAAPDAELSRAVLSSSYIAQGGLELGYALTAHKAEGLTVGAQWTRPDGTRNHGSVLVYAPGMDNPGLYVSLSRDKGQVVLFGARAELEGEREDLVYGTPRNQRELTDRVIAAVAERAAATADNANDRPVLVDLGQAPADPAGTSTEARRGTGTSAETTPPVPVPHPDRPAEPQPARQAPEPATERAPEPASKPVPEPVPEPVVVTDEQRQQWRELRQRSGAARRAGDRDAHRAIQAQRQALAARLGPERVEMLERESREELRRRVQDTSRRLERQRLAAQWQDRLHSRLTDTELAHAIRHAERQQTEHRTAADRARQQLAEQQPAVEAGRGPRVTRLDAELHRLRVNVERQGTVEEIERRWHALTTQAGEAAERATHKEFDAERTRWWQPGRREQLLAEAAADKAQSGRLQAQADELARPAAELQRQLGGPGVWRQAREQAERAEASYEQDRHRAHEADRRELDRLRDRAASHDTAVVDASTRRDELLAEQQLRTAMPEAQATLEHELRSQAIQQQHIEQATPELHSDLSPSRQMDLEYDHRSIEPDVGRGGPSLGL